MRPTATFILCASLCSLLIGGAARAQDPWAVRRSAFDPRVVARYKAMLNRRPNDAHTLVKLVSLYRKHRSLETLIKEFQAVARARPGSAGPQLILGHLNRRAGKRQQALERYRRAARIQPKDPIPVAAAGAILMRQGNNDEATKAYTRALALARSKKQQKSYLRALARVASADRKMAQASKYYEQLLALDPGNMRLRLELARAMALGGMDQKALHHFAQVLKRTGDSARKAQILKDMGNVHARLGQVKQAMKLFRKAMALTSRGHWLRRDLTERLIEIHRKQEQLGLLIADFEKRWKRRGPFQWEVLGRLYYETGNEARALAAYRAALKQAPYAVRTRLRLIALLERSGRSEKVLEEYHKLARYAPGEPRYRIELAKRLYQVGKHKEAVATLEKCGRLFSGDSSVHAMLRDLFNSWGYLKRAKQAAEKLVRIEPRDPTYVIALGEQYYTEGKKKKALAVWKRLLRVIPRRHLGMARLAEVYAAHKMDQQAIALYRKAIKLSPRNLAYHRSLALLFESKKMHSDALRTWETVMQLARAAKNSRSLREARGRLITVLQRSYGLRSRIRRLRNLFYSTKPDVEDGFFMALGYLKLGDLKRAGEIYQRIITLQPKNSQALQALVGVYIHQRKLKLAIELLERLARLEKHNAREYYHRISYLMWQLGRDDGALKYAHLARDPKDPRSFEKMGQVYERKGDYSRARAEYAEAIKLNPRQFSSLFALARLQSREGRPGEAEKLYRQVLKKATNPDAIHKAFKLVVNISSYRGTLGGLEKEILPLSVTSTNAKVYRQLLVKIYHRRIPLLIDQARRGNAATRRAARAELRRIGGRGLSPLLEELAQASSKNELIRYLGFLGNPNAVFPLLRIAEKKQEQVITIRGYRGNRYGRGRYRRYRRSGRLSRLSRLRSFRYRHHYRYGSRYTLPWNTSKSTRKLQVQAIVALGRIAHQRAAPGLIRLYDSQQSVIRDAAAWSLGRVASGSKDNTRTSVSRALFLGLGDIDSTVQMMACTGLAALGDPGMQPVMQEVMLDTRRHTRVRAACAWGLGVLRDRRSLEALVKVLLAGDGELQRNAAWSLGALQDSRAVAPLVRSLWTKRNRVRRAILWALARISSRTAGAATQTIQGGAQRPTLIPDVVLKDSRVDADDFLRRLTASLDDAYDATVARDLIPVIEVHGKAVGQGLEVALGRHRDIVLRVLRDLDAQPHSPGLGPFTAGRELLSPAERARLDVAVKRACSPLAAALVRLRSHRDALIRARSLSVLAKLAPQDLQAHLRHGLRDRRWSVRVNALESTARAHQRKVLSVDQVLALVRPSLKSRHWRERERAAGTLAGVGHPSMVPALDGAARDGNAFVREAAIKGLGRVGGKQAIRRLRRALGDGVPHVRIAAARALVTLGAPFARKALQRQTTDPHPLVREAANKALKQGS